MAANAIKKSLFHFIGLPAVGSGRHFKKRAKKILEIVLRAIYAFLIEGPRVYRRISPIHIHEEIDLQNNYEQHFRNRWNF